MKKVVFYFPWKEVSGGPYYLTRLANDLVKLNLYDIYYTDYVHGLSDTLLDDFRIHKLEYHDEGKMFKIFPNEPVIVIMPIYWAHMTPQLHLESKIVFFNWHNECITVLKKNWHIDEKLTDSFLELVRNTDAVFFCDKTHQLAQNTRKIIFKEQFVPIIIPKRDIAAEPKLISRNEYNVAVLGRLSPDKVYSTINLVENICELHLNKQVNIYVIGEGICQDLLFEKVFPQNINLIQCGTMKIESVISLLAGKVDILFAMGTSALEGASIHLPTVILPNDVKPIQCNKYPFIFQTKGYALGWNPTQIEELDLEYYSIKEIFNIIYEKKLKEKVGEECYSYYLKNHTSNIKQFIDVVERSFLTNLKMQEFILSMKNSKFYFKKIFGKITETFGKVKKRIVILGIPIVILTQTNEEHFNIYLCLIPTFRINRINRKLSIHLLIFVWGCKALYKAAKFLRKRIRVDNSCEKLTSLEENKFIIQRKRIEEKLINGEKITICLFESRISCWQFGNLYNLLDKNEKFEPIVVVIPFFSMGKQAMIEYMDETYISLKKQGYRVIKGYDKYHNEYLNIKKDIKPDAVFYSTFWKNHFQINSYINQFEEIYSFLFPYGYDISSHPDKEAMNFELQNKVTRFYLPTKIHKLIAEENMDNEGKNVYITGSPKIDFLLDKNYIPKNVWKKQEVLKKKVIWAPHHTLFEKMPNYQLCAFLDINEFMLELAEKFKETVQFAFKPHPMLKYRLNDLWGENKTEAYYNAWKYRENTQLETGEFIDLFLTSDAMILDSISFIAEYTILNKPAFFTLGNDSRLYLNKFGKEIYKVLYKNDESETLMEDLVEFINQVVIDKNDVKLEERNSFIKKYMLPEGNKTAAESIYDDICRIILDDVYWDYKVNI